MSEAQTIKTIIHEAAHQALHSREAGNEEAQNKSRNQKETEAESVAYVVCQHYGVQLIELHDIEKQNGHPSISGMKSICEQLLEAID